MAPHSHTLAWEIPWTEEPGRLQSMGSRRVGHEWLHFHFSVLCIGEGNGNPLQCSCLENPRDGGACWEAVSGVAQSRTWLKRLSSSSRDLFNKIAHIKGTFHKKMASIKDRNGKNLTEAEEIKKSWHIQKNYTKKVLMTQIAMMVWSLT